MWLPFLFTPGSANDPLVLSFPNGAFINSLWVVEPSVQAIFSAPNASGGWSPFYQIFQTTSESVPLDGLGYASVQISSGGKVGPAFYVWISDQPVSPYKEAPVVITLPATADLSAIGVYQYQAYGGLSNGAPANNGTALTNMFAAMAANNGGNGGGWGWIQSGSYPVYCVSGGYSVPDQCVIQGMGTAQNNGPGSSMFSIQSPGVFWNLAGPHTNGGTTIRNVAFAFTAGVQSLTNVALKLNVYKAIAKECLFQDCATSVGLLGGNCGLEDSTVTYNGITAGAAPNQWQSLVNLAAPDSWVRSTAIMQIGSQVGIVAIAPGHEHPSVQNCHLANTDVGIAYNLIGNCFNGDYLDLSFANNVYAVYGVPPSSTQTIYNETYTDCTMKRPPGQTSTTPATYWDTNGGPNANVTAITLKNCKVFQWGGHGHQFNSGQNFTLIGGFSKGNNPSGGAGIAVTGPIGNLTAIGVDLQPSFSQADIVQSQAYAFLIATNSQVVGIITLIGCPMNGYTTNPIGLGANAFALSGRLYVSLCPGYNDNPTAWAGLPTTAPTTATSAAANGYFGTTVIDLVASGLTVVAINGVNTQIQNLAAWNRTLGPWDTFQLVGGAVTSFHWRGVWA